MSQLAIGIIITVAASLILAVIVAAAKHWFANILKEIKKELVPNGGSSARDAIDRTERATAVLAAEIAAVKAALEAHILTLGKRRRKN